MADKFGVACLCIIAPFAPLRIAPKRYIPASFSYPDEFVLENFIDLIIDKYPKKEERPNLYLLLHSPGGSVSSSYMVARTLRSHFNKIVAFIPHIAASGATVVALSCDEIIMGNISRLSGIDPTYESDGQNVSALSVVRAFKYLENMLETKTLDEISYPYQHLVRTITAEKFDEATHTLDMVEKYATELMAKAGYAEEQIDAIVHALLFEIEAHEQVITLDSAKELGIKAIHFSNKPEYSECWKIMKEWLNKYFLEPSPVHVIKYCIPRQKVEGNSIGVNKELQQNTK